ncbi:hypothetical protein D3C73_1294550 [compost metagenome]
MQLRRQIGLPAQRSGFEHVRHGRASVVRTGIDQRITVHRTEIGEHRLLIPVRQHLSEGFSAETLSPGRIMRQALFALCGIGQPWIATFDNHALQAPGFTVTGVIHGNTSAQRIPHQPIAFDAMHL